MALAPRLLSISSLPPFLNRHPFQSPNPKPCFPKFHPQKPHNLTLCQSTPIQTQTPDSSVSATEPDGSGPSAPTRGEIFLQRHQASDASSTVHGAIKKKKSKNEMKAFKSSSVTVSSCYGRGAPLQTSESDAPGYMEQDMYNLKKKHKQLRKVLCGRRKILSHGHMVTAVGGNGGYSGGKQFVTAEELREKLSHLRHEKALIVTLLRKVLCQRCKMLSHGHMVTAVGGNGGYSGGKQFVTAEELREKLSHLCHEKALIVKLVDIVDFNGSFLASICDLAGANPIMLVVTKVDFLPKGTDFNCIGDWIAEATMKEKLNVLSVHLTCSKSLVGITGVISDIQKEKKGRDGYILGSADVGNLHSLMLF